MLLLQQLFLSFLLVCTGPHAPQRFFAKTIGIKDGETIEVLKGKEPVVIRLASIDCPEKSQPFGQAAKKFTSDFCFTKMVQIVPTGKKDRYKRVIAWVYIDSICLNKELIKEGLAWHFTQYSTDKNLDTLEAAARTARVGLWADDHPTAPWKWRKPIKIKKVS